VRRIAIAALAGGLGLAAALGLTAHAGSGAIPTVPCEDVIGRAKSGRAGGNRVVLGVVSVPPARLTQVVATESRPWAFWRKARSSCARGVFR
jgi:hypothetical protein